MKKEDSKILDKLGKNPGFKTPDNFFEDFGKNLMDKLPEVTITEKEEVEKPTMWLRLRPYAYMAAMIAGIACMMTIFTQLTSDKKQSGMAEDLGGQMGGTVIMQSPTLGDTSVTNYEDSVRNSSCEYIK